jgi:hypothetical protein
VNIAPAHLDALKAFGYTEAEAEFLYIVATHSGYFRNRQFLIYTGAYWGSRTRNFFSKMARLRHVRTERFPKSGVIHQIFSRRLYHQIGRENLRNRRAHEIDFIKQRIAILDFVIANQEHEYLETETQKISYFREKLGVNEGYFPARLYLGRKSSTATVRYFVDNFPIFLCSPSSVVTFSYVHDDTSSFSGFLRHLGTYLPLFRQLSEFQMLYVSRTDVHFARAKEIFESLVKIPLESDIAEDLLRYFRVRRMWEQKQYAEVSDAELVFRNEARSRFHGRTFEGLYQNWKRGQVSAAAIEKKFPSNDRSRTVRFETYLLGPIQFSDRDSGKSDAESKNLRSVSSRLASSSSRRDQGSFAAREVGKPERTKVRFGPSTNHLRRNTMSIIKKAPEMMAREVKLEQPVNELLEDYARFIESSADHVVNAVLKKMLWRDLEYRKWRGQRRGGQSSTEKNQASEEETRG